MEMGESDGRMTFAEPSAAELLLSSTACSVLLAHCVTILSLSIIIIKILFQRERE
jgi:hypothetical protein